MAAVVGSLRVELAANIARLNSDMAKAGRSIASMVQGQVRSFARLGARGRLAIGTITAALGGAIASVAALGKHGTTLAGVADSFAALTTSVGESGDEMLRLTREATSGLIKDLDIMAAANKGLLLGLPITSTEMAKLGKTASVLGAAMGQDATKSLDDLITALGRSSPLILDNLGLTVKSAEANERYASTLGVSVKELTDAQKKQAFYNAAIDSAQQKLLDLSEAPLTFGQRLDVLQIGFQNFVDTLSIAISKSPALNTALGAIGTAMQAAFGSRQADLVEIIMGLVDKLAIGIVDMAQLGVQAARLLRGTWSALKLMFSSVMFAITGGLELIAKGIAKVAQVAAKLPGQLGERFRAAGELAQNMADHFEGMRRSFNQQTIETAANSERQDAALKTLAGSLGQVKADMIASTQAARENTTTATGLSAETGALETAQRAAAVAASEHTQALKETKTEVLEGVSAFSMLRGAVGGWSEVNELSIPVLESMKAVQLELGSKTIPGLTESMSTLREGVESVKVEIDNTISTSRALKRVFGAAKGWIGDVKDAFFDLGNVTQSVITAAFGPGGIVTGLFQRGMSKLADLAWAGLRKIGGFFKRMFGGPSADELAGREIVARFEANLSTMLNDTQRIEAGNESWKETVIVLRDAYIAQGLSEQEALRDAERLWKSSKESAEASARVIEEITRKMGKFGEEARKAKNAVDAIPPVPSAPGVVPLQHGGIVTRPTMALIGERGPEAVIPLRQVGGVAGGVGAEALGRFERLLLEQPAMMIRAWRDAQLLVSPLVR